jgi:hypothetical protein
MTAARENLDTSLIITVGVLLVILTFVLILLLQAGFYRAEAEENTRKVVEPRSEELASLRAAQEADLHAYRWIDKEKGRIGIPVERAMAEIVREGL